MAVTTFGAGGYRSPLAATPVRFGYLQRRLQRDDEQPTANPDKTETDLVKYQQNKALDIQPARKRDLLPTANAARWRCQPAAGAALSQQR